MQSVKFSKKRRTLIWYLNSYLVVALAIPVSFLILVDLFGQELERDFVLHTLSSLFLAAFVVFCILVIVSVLEIKNRLFYALDKLEEGDYTSRVVIPKEMPVELERIMSGFNRIMENTEHLLKETKEAMVEQKNAEIAALEAQIDPHFLYNTLDTINWKAIEHEDYEVSDMVGALADILRYTIRNPNEVCSIEQEIYWLEQYIFFQKAKLGKDLKIIYDVPEELKGYEIHKLILQPFVENSIKHGFPKVDHPCELKIKMRDAGEQLHIIIKDNGVGMSEEVMDLYNQRQEDMQNHLGIANVCRRLRLYYGEEADIFFESEADKYTKVHLFIPKRNRLNSDEHSDCGR